MIHDPNSITRSDTPPPLPPQTKNLSGFCCRSKKQKLFYILARGTNKAWEYIYINKKNTPLILYFIVTRSYDLSREKKEELKGYREWKWNLCTKWEHFIMLHSFLMWAWLCLTALCNLFIVFIHLLRPTPSCLLCRDKTKNYPLPLPSPFFWYFYMDAQYSEHYCDALYN